MKTARLLALLLLGATATATATASAQPEDRLFGTWRLMGFTAQIVPTGENVSAFGNAPQGYLTYGRDGRMFVMIVKESRPKRSDLTQMTDGERLELFNTMVAYGGTFKVDGNRIVHEVDISWNENWTGTKQVRRFRLEGRELVLTQDPQVGPDGRRASAELRWERTP